MLYEIVLWYQHTKTSRENFDFARCWSTLSSKTRCSKKLSGSRFAVFYLSSTLPKNHQCFQFRQNVGAKKISKLLVDVFPNLNFCKKNTMEFRNKHSRAAHYLRRTSQTKRGKLCCFFPKPLSGKTAKTAVSFDIPTNSASFFFFNTTCFTSREKITINNLYPEEEYSKNHHFLFLPNLDNRKCQ